MIELKPTTSKNLTNEEFLVRLINFSKYGALAQLVVLDALRIGLQHIVNAEEEFLALEKAKEAKRALQEEQREKDGTRGIGTHTIDVSPNWIAWVAVAEDILWEYNQKYT